MRQARTKEKSATLEYGLPLKVSELGEQTYLVSSAIQRLTGITRQAISFAESKGYIVRRSFEHYPHFGYRWFDVWRLWRRKICSGKILVDTKDGKMNLKEFAAAFCCDQTQDFCLFVRSAELSFGGRKTRGDLKDWVQLLNHWEVCQGLLRPCWKAWGTLERLVSLSEAAEAAAVKEATVREAGRVGLIRKYELSPRKHLYHLGDVAQRWMIESLDGWIRWSALIKLVGISDHNLKMIVDCYSIVVRGTKQQRFVRKDDVLSVMKEADFDPARRATKGTTIRDG